RGAGLGRHRDPLGDRGGRAAVRRPAPGDRGGPFRALRGEAAAARRAAGRDGRPRGHPDPAPAAAAQAARRPRDHPHRAQLQPDSRCLRPGEPVAARRDHFRPARGGHLGRRTAGAGARRISHRRLVNPPRIAMNSLSRRQALAAAALAAGAGTLAAPAANAAADSSSSAAASHGRRPTISREPFGQINGAVVYRYTLTAGNGLTVRILTYGGIVQTVLVPDRRGHPVDLVLGFATLDDYVAHNSPAAGGGVYFGALIGRYANRIAKGTFTLDGVTYHIPINNNGNALHGGTVGFDQKIWTPSASSGHDSVSLRLEYVSPDGEMGFPGTLTTQATYTLDNRGR